jgi:hypothetical protein
MGRPFRVRLKGLSWFSAKSAMAMGAQVVITGPSGPVQTGSPIVVDNSAWQPLAADAPPGNYEVAWRVTSADGHPITGAFRFTAEAAGAGQVPPESSPLSATNQSGGRVCPQRTGARCRASPCSWCRSIALAQNAPPSGRLFAVSLTPSSKPAALNCRSTA